MEDRHVETLRDGIGVGDIYKIFVFEIVEDAHTPYQPHIYARDYEGYFDEEGVHHAPRLWVESRGSSIEITIAEERHIQCTEDHPQWRGRTANDGTPVRRQVTADIKKDVGRVGDNELYAEIERCIDEVT